MKKLLPVLFGLIMMLAAFAAVSMARDAWASPPEPTPTLMPATPTPRIMAVEPQPTKAPPMIYQLINAADAGDLVSVERIAKQLISLGKNTSQAYQVWALTLIDHGHYADAYRITLEASSEFPEEPWFSYLRGQASFYMGEYQIAREHFKWVVELNSNPDLVVQSNEWIAKVEKHLDK